MPMYNLLEYSRNYKKTTGALQNYYRNKPINPLSSDSESFKYKTSITGKTPENNDSLLNAKLVILLKYLRYFWKSLNIPLINCEVELILTWSKNCVFADMITRDAEDDNPAFVAPSGATFKITQNYMFQLLLYQKKMTQNFQNN